jgi:acyl-CoA dehydrogenase
VDFTMTGGQRDLGDLARAILADRVTPDRLREVEAKGEGWDPELWAELARAGVLAAALPEAAGGDGFGLLEQCTVLVEIGRAVAPVPYLASIVVAASAVARSGSAEQCDQWAVPAGRGEVVLTAALGGEPVRATRSADRWVLTGTRAAVPAAPYADLVLVPTDSGVFLVRPDDEGVRVRPQQLVDGDGAGLVELSGVALSGDRVLGGGATWLRTRAEIGLCATQLGVLERALAMTAEHANARVQFGRPVGAFQAVAQRLADAYIDVEAVRLTLWQAAWRLAAGLPCDTEVSTAKFWAADAGHRVAHTAVHIHGGVGVDLDHPLHRYFVAATFNEMHLGGATVHLGRIGAALAGAGSPPPPGPAMP